MGRSSGAGGPKKLSSDYKINSNRDGSKPGTILEKMGSARLGRFNTSGKQQEVDDQQGSVPMDYQEGVMSSGGNQRRHKYKSEAISEESSFSSIADQAAKSNIRVNRAQIEHIRKQKKQLHKKLQSSLEPTPKITSPVDYEDVVSVDDINQGACFVIEHSFNDAGRLESKRTAEMGAKREKFHMKP